MKTGLAEHRAPTHVDWLIIHQFDAGRASPGGIDTVIRGICRYTDPSVSIAVVGVDTSPAGDSARVGHWERHRYGERTIDFLPVARLDPADQSRRIPHTALLVTGVLRFLPLLPRAERLQCHRMDTALILSSLLRKPLMYVIHSQAQGMTSRTSDSFWRYLGDIHPRLEDLVIRRAADVGVFSPPRLETVRAVNPLARLSPTWWEPRLVEQARAEAPERDPHRLVWIGRIERPKAADFAVDAFEELVRMDAHAPWSLHFYGPGSETDALRERIADLEDSVRQRVHLHGPIGPEQVAGVQAVSGTFLITTHPGYEGFPTVIVESLAAGMPVVATEGADPAGLVVDGVNGFTTPRDPQRFARSILQSVSLDRSPIPESVAEFSAPAVVGRLMQAPAGIPGPFRARLVVRDDQLLLDDMPLMVGSTGELDDALDLLTASGRPELVVTANVDHVLTLGRSPALLEAYRCASLRLVDGMPLIAVARAIGKPDAQRQTGADLLPHAVAVSAIRRWRVVITGGEDAVAAQAVRRLARLFPEADVHHLPFPLLSSLADPDSLRVIDRLHELRPDLVFLCLGSPKQEGWFSTWRDRLPAAVYIGAGAAVDFAAGTRRRAPVRLQSIGLEWAWRLAQEPRRMAHRYLVRGPGFLPVAVRSIAQHSVQEPAASRRSRHRQDIRPRAGLQRPLPAGRRSASPQPTTARSGE